MQRKQRIRKRPDQEIYLTCLLVKLCTFSGAHFHQSEPLFLLKGRCGVSAKIKVFLGPKNGGECANEALGDRLAPKETCPFAMGGEDWLKPTVHRSG